MRWRETQLQWPSRRRRSQPSRRPLLTLPAERVRDEARNQAPLAVIVFRRVRMARRKIVAVIVVERFRDLRGSSVGRNRPRRSAIAERRREQAVVGMQDVREQVAYRIGELQHMISLGCEVRNAFTASLCRAVLREQAIAIHGCSCQTYGASTASRALCRFENHACAETMRGV